MEWNLFPPDEEVSKPTELEAQPHTAASRCDNWVAEKEELCVACTISTINSILKNVIPGISQVEKEVTLDE